MAKIGIIGSGAWGTALAILWARTGHAVTLWTHDADLIPEMLRKRENIKYLPGFAFPDGLELTNDLIDLAGSEIVCSVVPAQHSRAVWRDLKLPDGTLFVVCSKGMEIATGHLLSDVSDEVVPHLTIGVMTGPSFAEEVASGKPAALTLACRDDTAIGFSMRNLSTPTFRLYSSDDVTGASVGGAVKNVIAIASGIVEGFGLGSNARAALLTRGLAELMRFNRALGGRAETMVGLAGVGDLMLTATSTQSRNYSLGTELGRGRSLRDVMGKRVTVSEGVYTVKAVARIADDHGISMPICQTLNRVLEDSLPVRDAVAALMTRPLKEENA